MRSIRTISCCTPMRHGMRPRPIRRMPRPRQRPSTRRSRSLPCDPGARPRRWTRSTLRSRSTCRATGRSCSPPFDDLAFVGGMFVAQHQIIGDVVEHGVDLLERHAVTAMIGKPVQRELEHAVALLCGCPRRLAGLPVDDLDAITASVDGIELADQDVRRAPIVELQGEIDLGLDLNGLEVGPLTPFEDRTQRVELTFILDAGCGDSRPLVAVIEVP